MNNIITYYDFFYKSQNYDLRHFLSDEIEALDPTTPSEGLFFTTAQSNYYILVAYFQHCARLFRPSEHPKHDHLHQRTAQAF
jgi:hypothetical protein